MRYLSAAMDYLPTHNSYLSRLFDKYIVMRKYSSDNYLVDTYILYTRKMFGKESRHKDSLLKYVYIRELLDMLILIG